MSSIDSVAVTTDSVQKRRLGRWARWAVQFAAFMVLTTIGYVLLPSSGIYVFLIPVVAGVVVAVVRRALMHLRK